jgi:hypothetical protein
VPHRRSLRRQPARFNGRSGDSGALASIDACDYRRGLPAHQGSEAGILWLTAFGALQALLWSRESLLTESAAAKPEFTSGSSPDPFQALDLDRLPFAAARRWDSAFVQRCRRMQRPMLA